MIYETLHKKVKIENHEPQKTGMNITIIKLGLFSEMIFKSLDIYDHCIRFIFCTKIKGR